MKYAVFSDVHSNIEALDAVLSKISEEKVDGYIFCGDIVGYGPSPNECVEKIKNIKNIKLVAGNHDRATVGLFDINWFNDNAKAVINWTAALLTEENKNFLRQLPEKLQTDNFTVVHGSPREPVSEYLLELPDIHQNMDFFSTPVCFIGHSHIPFTYSADMGIREFSEYQITSKSIINAGSVGQPRDGDNRSCFLIFENDKIKFFRVEYDITSVQEKMRREKLPEHLIERLTYGR